MFHKEIKLLIKKISGRANRKDIKLVFAFFKNQQKNGKKRH